MAKPSECPPPGSAALAMLSVLLLVGCASAPPRIASPAPPRIDAPVPARFESPGARAAGAAIELLKLGAPGLRRAFAFTPAVAPMAKEAKDIVEHAASALPVDAPGDSRSQARFQQRLIHRSC